MSCRSCCRFLHAGSLPSCRMGGIWWQHQLHVSSSACVKLHDQSSAGAVHLTQCLQLLKDGVYPATLRPGDGDNACVSLCKENSCQMSCEQDSGSAAIPHGITCLLSAPPMRSAIQVPKLDVYSMAQA